MRKGILKSFLSSGLQAISVQVFGVIFMLLGSYVLSKEDFGIVNWANASAMLITTLLSFGMEQVVVRRIAVSESSNWAAAAFLVHNFITSVFSLLLVYLLAVWLGDEYTALKYLPLYLAAQAIVFLVTPLKQFLNAKQRFAPYAVIAAISNLFKIALGVILMQTSQFTITTMGLILICCSAFEFVALYIHVAKKADFKLKFKWVAYNKLVKESMPQFLAIIFDSSLSRLDWILLGLIGTYAAIGDYSFAYRAYELARLPIAIIAPIIINIFARMLQTGNRLDEERQQQINQFYKVEMFVAMLIPLGANVLWSPVLDMIFQGKYGSSNALLFLLLSLCIPIQFFVNLLWTITFCARKYKKITAITIIAAIVNLVFNLILIPLYGSLGAAIAYILTTIVQATAYYYIVNKHLFNISLFTIVKFMAIAIISYAVCKFSSVHVALQLFIAVATYLVLCFTTGSIRFSYLYKMKDYFKR